ESADHEIGIHLCDLLRRHAGAEFCQHFEPNAEAIGVELLVHAWLREAPQVQIKDAPELFGCRQHHELAAILESARLNDAVKQFGLQPWNNVLQVRGVKNAIEYGTTVLAFSWCGTLEVLHVTSGNQPLQCCMF